MKDFLSYKDEIYKCSKCGLCQAVCPVYKQTLDECCVSRGKFIILNGIIKKDIKLSELIIKDFDICTSCNACSDFCPSNIEACDIFASVKKHYYEEKNKNSFFHSAKFFEFNLKCVSLAANSYRFFCFDKITAFIKPILQKLGSFGNFFTFSKSVLELHPTIKQPSKNVQRTEKIIFFKGCYNKYINPQSANSTMELLTSAGFSFSAPDFPCCGISKYYEGIDISENVKQIFEKIPKDTDFIVCDCATCTFGLSKYTEMFDEASFFKNKIISIEDLLIYAKFNKSFNKKRKITYHKPCHGKDYSDFLKSINNVEFIEIEQSCCGFAGEFALKHPQIASDIGNKKAQQILNTGAEIVVTSCPSCITGLKLALNNTNVKVLSVAEFLTSD